MYFTVITLNGMVIYCNTSLAQIRISFQRALLSEIIQGRNNFKSRSRRICTICSTVKKTAVILIIDKRIPVLCNGIRIKIRFAYHGKDSSCRRLYDNYRSSAVTQRIICCCLKISIQTWYHGISLILFAQKLIFHLLQEKRMGSQKLKIRLWFQSAFAVGIISYRMCKNICKWISSLFCSIFIHIGLCQDFSIRRLDASTHYPVWKRILSGIIRTVDKIVTFYGIKINQIPDQTDKNQYKEHRYKSKRPVLFSTEPGDIPFSQALLSFKRFFSLRFNFFVLIFPQNIQSLNDCKHQDGTHDRTSSITYQRKCNTCHRNKFGRTANSQKYLKRIFCSKSQCDQFIKRISYLQCNRNDHEKETGTYQDQADGKNAAQFFTDSAEDKVIFYNRNFLRRALAKPHSKPTTSSDSKQWLHDLIAFILIDRHRISPGAHSLAYMSEKMISYHCTNTSTAKSQEHISRISGCHIDQHKIGDKKDHRTSKISGKDQNSHMDHRYDRCHHYFTKIYLCAEQRCHKKYKCDLDHLWRLDSHQWKFCAITCTCQNENRCQKNNTDPCINPCKIL